MSRKTKRWNIGLIVSPEEEQKIKIDAIRKGMGVADYVKEVLLENLSANNLSIQGKSKNESLKARSFALTKNKKYVCSDR